MKKFFLVVAITAIAFIQNSAAQDTTKQDQLPRLLASYYNIKNALVAGNAGDAASAATVFIKTANSIDDKVISAGSISALVKEAGRLSQTRDIKKQREIFADFSADMAAVAKTVKITGKPVYYDYCPMKKAYWLSSEREIKNPYYGSSMLTCGAVAEIIQ